MPQMQNRVQETTTTGGTGTLTLSGAVTGYITFASGFSTGASLFYTVDNGVGEWEIGIGTLVTTGTLSRVTVIASSNGGALVNFGSGTKRVFCSAPTRSLVPDQDSNSGKVLTTDGTNPAWTTTLNGITIGNLTAAAGAFTTLSASSTVSGTGFSTYLASPPAIGGTTPAAGNFTTLITSSTVTLNGGTANGVGYLNASKVLTTGTALTFQNGNLTIGTGADVGYRINAEAAGPNALRFLNTSGLGATILLADQGSSAAISQNNGTIQFDIGSSEQMRLTSTGLGIGLGGGSPGEKLEVNGRIAAKSSADLNLAFVLNNTASGGREWQLIGSATGGMDGGGTFNVRDNTAGANRVTLDSSGNLGLGVTPSAWAPYRAFQLGLSGAIFGDAGSRNVFVSNNLYYTGSQFAYLLTGPASYYQQSNTGQHVWYTAPSGTAGSTISFTQAMALTAAGDLGVYGSITANANVSGQGISIFRNGADGGGIVAGLNNASLSFQTSSTERARITSAGDLLVGYTGTPGQKVSWSGANAGDNSVIWSNVSSTTINLATVFPTLVVSSGATLSVQMQICTSSAPGAASSYFIIGLRNGNSTWAFSSVASATTSGATVAASGSSNTITLTFSGGGQYGQCKITVISS